jgi:flagellar biosynthesis/type III secretory pathway ATPase
MDEPVADEVRGIVDGHLVFSRELASMGHYPAIDVSQSISRVMNAVSDDDHIKMATHIKSLVSVLKTNFDLLRAGAYALGTDPLLDEALKKQKCLNSFLRQSSESTQFPETLHLMNLLMK